MFDHVTIRASSRAAAERFYEIVLRPVEIEKTFSDDDYAEWNDFSLAEASAEKPVTRRLHIGFVAPSRAHVDEFWRVGTEAVLVLATLAQRWRLRLVPGYEARLEPRVTLRPKGGMPMTVEPRLS